MHSKGNIHRRSSTGSMNIHGNCKAIAVVVIVRIYL